MNKSLPDKWVRKAIYDAIDNISVIGNAIPIYDTNIPVGNIPNYYILMTTQTNEVDKNNKCEYFWQSSILLDIVTSYDLPGNPGSRLLADEVADSVRNALNSVELEIGSGLDIITRTQSFPNDISTTTRNENIFRKFIRWELTIK